MQPIPPRVRLGRIALSNLPVLYSSIEEAGIAETFVDAWVDEHRDAIAEILRLSRRAVAVASDPDSARNVLADGMPRLSANAVRLILGTDRLRGLMITAVAETDPRFIEAMREVVDAFSFALGEDSED